MSKVNKANREYKNSVFKDLFSDEATALDLYNALTDSRFTIDDGLCFTTLEMPCSWGNSTMYRSQSVINWWFSLSIRLLFPRTSRSWEGRQPGNTINSGFSGIRVYRLKPKSPILFGVNTPLLINFPAKEAQ